MKIARYIPDSVRDIFGGSDTYALNQVGGVPVSDVPADKHYPEQVETDKHYPEQVETFCRRLHEYAARSALDHPDDHYRALLVVVGDGSVVRDSGFSQPMRRKRYAQILLDDFIGVPIIDDDVYHLFDLMNTKLTEGGALINGHRDGAILFDNNGIMVKAGVRIIHPEYAGTERTDEEVIRIKRGDEVGTRHTTAIHASMVDGIDLTAALSESAGTLIPFVKGAIIDEFVFDPKTQVVVPRGYVPDEGAVDQEQRTVEAI